MSILKLFKVLLFFQISLLYALVYDLNFLVFDNNKNLVYNLSFECDGKEKFINCLLSNVNLSELMDLSLEKQIFSFLEIKEKDLENKLLSLQNTGKYTLYKEFYRIFGNDIVVYKNAMKTDNKFSEVIDETSFDNKSYSLLLKFLFEYYNKRKNEFIDEVLEFNKGNNDLIKRGLYYKIYMITENLEGGGVDEPPIVYLYENLFNPIFGLEKNSYLMSFAYETKTRSNNNLNPPSNIVRFASSSGAFRGFLLNILPFFDQKTSGYYGLINDPLFDYFNIFTFSLIFKLTGVPVFVEWSSGDNDKTSQIWRESLNEAEENRVFYPLLKLGIDFTSHDVCNQGSATCKYFYRLSNGTDVFVGFPNDLINKIENDEINGSLQLEYSFFCPSTKNNNNLLATFISMRGTLDNEDDIIDFLENIEDECKNFVINFVNNFLDPNEINCGNNVIEVYKADCEYVDAYSISTGIILQDSLEVDTPVFYWLVSSKDYVYLFDKPLDDFLVELFDLNSYGDSYYCVGNRCAYFFLSKDSPDYLKQAYPKMIYLHKFIISNLN